MAPVKMHDDEVDTDVDLVRRLLTEQFPHWAGLDIEAVESSGTDNAMYRVGEDLVARLPRIEDAVASVRREQRWLPRLAPGLPVAISAPLGLGAPGEGYPWEWSVFGWLDGENPTAGAVAEPEALAEDLADFITALRRVDPVGGPSAGRGVPLATRDTATRDALSRLDGIIDTDTAGAIWDDALRLPAWSGPSTWLHGDISPGNVLVEGDRLTGVIDFALGGVGDPTVDLIVAWNLLPAQARGVFRAAMGVDEETWLRGRGWALSIALIQLPYYCETNPALAANSRHVIGEVIAEY